MKMKNLVQCVFVAFLLSILVLPLSLSAADREHVRRFTCSPRHSINHEILTLKPGDTLLVNGTCNENIVIPDEISRITLDGDNRTATINGGSSETVKDAIYIRGRGITVKGFKITGGGHGITVEEGASATIDNNEIAFTNNRGITINNNSTATIINNDIHNNVRHGIRVMNNSSAHIGVAFPNGSSKVSGPNFIKSNGNVIGTVNGNGILVRYSSFARIEGNFIENNRQGITVDGGSFSAIINNTFNGNDWGNIAITGGSQTEETLNRP